MAKSEHERMHANCDGHCKSDDHKWDDKKERKEAERRVKLGLRFNFEMVLLPREVFASRGRRFTITCGNAIPWQSLGRPSEAEAARIRGIVYNLKDYHGKDNIAS